MGEADGNDIGCAISRNLLGTQWYASDFRVPHGTSPSVGTVHYGPFAMREQARAQVDPVAIEYLDSQGTNGLSLWLVLPI